MRPPALRLLAPAVLALAVGPAGAQVTLPAPVPCSQVAPLSFDADADGEVTADDFASVSGAFRGATGEFAGILHDSVVNPEPIPFPPDIDLSTCSFVTFDPFTERITFAAVTTGRVEADSTYVLATAGGDQGLRPDVLFDTPGAFALVEGTATEGADLSTVLDRVVAAVVYDRDRDVFGSRAGGASEAQVAAFASAFAAVFGGRGTSAESGADAGLAVRAWPNPSSGRATVVFGLAEGGAARVAVYDVLGREVAVVAEGAFGAGRHEAPVSDLAAGAYVVRVQTATGVQTARLTVVR